MREEERTAVMTISLIDSISAIAIVGKRSLASNLVATVCHAEVLIPKGGIGREDRPNTTRKRIEAERCHSLSRFGCE